MPQIKSLVRFNIAVVLVVAVGVSTGCRSSDSKADDPGTPAKSPARTQPARSNSQPKPAAPAKRQTLTAASNPTTLAGRGAPDLEDKDRPAAWIYIDGHAGQFKEENGHPLLQWFTEGVVSTSPTFRVEAFGPLLGTPKDFKAVLRTIEATDGSEVVYGIAAYDGTFEVGRDYPLLNPGEGFIIRNGQTGDVVKEVAPLSAGTYAIAAGVKNTATGKETLAVTYFTVGEK